jgi:gliding motility-associated lipoprotein GldB
MLYKFFMIPLILLFFVACNSNDKIIKDAENSNVKLKVNHLENELFNLKNKDEAQVFLNNHPDFVKNYLELPFPVVDSQFVSVFYKFYSDPNLKAFYDETRNKFGDFSEQKAELTHLFQYIKYFYPDYFVPEIKTLISGFKFDKDIQLGDSSIFISYDYFLGPDASYRPEMYEYILTRYQKPYLVPIVALALSGQFNHANLKDESMMASMIYYGKSHYFIERMMPHLPDSLNIGYTSEQLKGVESNMDLIWGHFIQNELLYNKIRFVNEKYCGERPGIPEIGDKCPGRIGRYLGWQIVRNYMKNNPNVTFQQLMEEEDAQKIFSKSNFKPR